MIDLRFVVNQAPPRILSENVQRRTSFRKWAPIAAALKADAITEIRTQMAADHAPIEAPVRLDIVIAWERGRKNLDFDSAVNSLKAILDAMNPKGAAVWIDDAIVCEISIAQFVTEERRGATFIRIREASQAPGARIEIEDGAIVAYIPD